MPRAEDAWFNANAMYTYMREADQGANDSRNSILLRSDVRTLFDQKKLTIVTKSDGWVVHVPAGDGLPTEELAALYHNVRLQPLVGVSVECLFARFAWSVLSLSPMFLLANVPRRLVIVRGNETAIRDVSGPECRIYAAMPGGKSRSQSPKKRPRDDGLGDDDGRSPRSEDWDDGDSPRRGRSRKRRRGSWFDTDPSTTSSFTLERVPRREILWQTWRRSRLFWSGPRQVSRHPSPRLGIGTASSDEFMTLISLAQSGRASMEHGRALPACKHPIPGRLTLVWGDVSPLWDTTTVPQREMAL